jgi:hypothetical protein
MGDGTRCTLPLKRGKMMRKIVVAYQMPGANTETHLIQVDFLLMNITRIN